MALIGNDEHKSYELIIYKDKQNILTRAKLQPTFSYMLLRDNYSSFYDDQNQNWSVLYDNAKDYTEFCAELEKRNVTIVESFKKSDNTSASPKKQSEDTKMIGIQAAVENVGKKDDGDHSDSSEAQMKANILSRMAKMGQAILPATAAAAAQGGLSSDCADSDSDISSISRKSRKTKRVEKPPISTNKPELSRVIKPLPVNSTANSQQRLSDMSSLHQVVPMQNAFPQSNTLNNQPLVSPVFDPMNLLLAENRTHNCEVRMNLNQLSSKMDAVLKRIEQNDKDTAEENLLRTKVKTLELKVTNLSNELEKALNDNVILQEKISGRKSGDNVDLREKEAVIQQKNERIEQLEKELREKQACINSLEDESKNFKSYKLFVKDGIECLEKNNFDELEKICNKYNSDALLGSFFQSLCKELVKLKSKQNSNNENSDVETHNVKIKKFTEKLNAVMQDFQQYITKHFDASNNTFPPDFISNLLPKSTRTATNYLIKEFEKDFKVSDENASVFKPVSLSESDD